jgi:pimeloyl-ACP methyl ester carboxylesterase
MTSDDSAKTQLPTAVTVPCFSGAPWDLEKLKPLSHLPLKTMRLPEGKDDVEQYADFVAQQVAELGCYVLVGDSFGALVSLAFATRRPPRLGALIMSGGFAANPVRNAVLRARIRAARFLPGPLYRMITLRLHAASLSSPYDAEGQVPWSEAKTIKLFSENTPYRSYVARAKAALEADYLDRLDRVDVPTLIITPEHDTLIGERASHEMLHGIQDVREVVLERTGHMLRYSHPMMYAQTILTFLRKKFGDDLQEACS